MQFRDLKRQYEVLRQDIDTAMVTVASSGEFIMGNPVRELEKELAEYIQVKHCVSCANGTDALTLALKVWEIGKGDAVFVPDFTFFASAEVVSLEGATPIFVDVDQNTFNIDCADLECKIVKVLNAGKLIPKVILAVDLFGLPADYLSIRKIADKYNLLILEDGAQGFGGMINGKRACSFGDIATTSFFPAKPLGCYGDGGALFTNNDEWALIADSYRVHGKGTFKYDNVRIGMNSRLDTLQAAILKIKLRAFCNYELADINAAAAKYSAKLRDFVKIPIIPQGYYSSWAQYTIQLTSKEQRDTLQSKLKAHGIPSMVYYPIPLHTQTAYRSLNVSHCPVTVKLCEAVLSLPIHPYISDKDINAVCGVIIN